MTPDHDLDDKESKKKNFDLKFLCRKFVCKSLMLHQIANITFSSIWSLYGQTLATTFSSILKVASFVIWNFKRHFSAEHAHEICPFNTEIWGNSPMTATAFIHSWVILVFYWKSTNHPAPNQEEGTNIIRIVSVTNTLKIAVNVNYRVATFRCHFPKKYTLEINSASFYQKKYNDLR